jgi:hypothetical protein
MLLGGGENAECTFQYTAPGAGDTSPNRTLLYLGFHDATGATAPVDGVWIQVDSTVFSGHTSSNSSAKGTATVHTGAAGAWYTARVSLNATASLCTFLLDSLGVTVWTDTLKTVSMIPTGAGRFTGCKFMATSTGTAAAFEMIGVDWIAFWMDGRSLTR